LITALCGALSTSSNIIFSPFLKRPKSAGPC
jgi:hypothetical protein